MLRAEQLGGHFCWVQVATNALLERKGEACCLVTTKGFRDLLHIGNQSRPAIFDLEIRVPDVLYSQVVEVDEQVCCLACTLHVIISSIKPSWRQCLCTGSAH